MEGASGSREQARCRNRHQLDGDRHHSGHHVPTPFRTRGGMTSDKVLDEMVELQDEITEAMPFRDLATLRLARKIVCDGALPLQSSPEAARGAVQDARSVCRIRPAWRL